VLGRFLQTLTARFKTAFEQPIRPGSMLLWGVRGLFGAVIIGMALIAFRHFTVATNDPFPGWMAFFTTLGAGILIVVTDVLFRDKQITTISAIYFGLLLGLLLGNILSSALEPFLFDFESNHPNAPARVDVFVRLEGQEPRDGKKEDGPRPSEGEKKVLATASTAYPTEGQPEREQLRRRRTVALFLTIVCCYVCISTLLQTKDEFRFIIPYVEFSRQVKGPKPLVLDTSVIIDGRIADICDTRFLDSKLIVPRFVLQELQSVADSSDKLKRNRGRRGLDMLKRMQNNSRIDLQMHEANLPELREVHKVDERLVVLAKALGARVVTNDYNLNKIAQLQGVEVINLNELANALKSVALPGETMVVKVVKPGDQIGQGVGYLEDGTMVVVEQGRNYLGQDVLIVVTSVLQTPAGRMIFGRVEGRAGSAANTTGPATSS
jgi:uncharacterized protein YacL